MRKLGREAQSVVLLLEVIAEVIAEAVAEAVAEAFAEVKSCLGRHRHT
jgi:hypothetical protein